MKYLLNIFEHKSISDYTRQLNKSEFDDILNKYCKNFSYDDCPIYKGIHDESTYKIVNPKKITRVSANTTNHYTIIFDNNPYRGEFPKRNNSLICTTSEYTSSTYGSEYRVIPFDNAKIVICSKSDMWYSFDTELYDIYNLEDFNVYLKIEMIKHGFAPYEDNRLINELKEFFKVYKKSKIKKYLLPNSMEELFQLFNPYKNDFQLLEYNKYKNININYWKHNQREIFTDSICLLERIN